MPSSIPRRCPRPRASARGSSISRPLYKSSSDLPPLDGGDLVCEAALRSLVIRGIARFLTATANLDVHAARLSVVRPVETSLETLDQ